jgi:hypothetical protein
MTDNPKHILQPLSGVRQKKESDKAVQACNDFLRLGSGRSIPKLIAYYTDKQNFSKGFIAPSKSTSTLNIWSSNYDWSSRKSEYDLTFEDRKNAEREAVFNRGLALEYNRINELYRLADLLRGQIYEQGLDEDGEYTGVFHNVWVPDVKQIGSGDDAERVDIERFNASLISEYRAVLDDIAKETGGRIKKVSADIPNGIKVIIEYADHNPKTDIT